MDLIRVQTDFSCCICLTEEPILLMGFAEVELFPVFTDIRLSTSSANKELSIWYTVALCKYSVMYEIVLFQTETLMGCTIPLFFFFFI